ncbi:MAG: hypothetical protein QG604_136 [Candidatus Dependentiae bacterium]|nr:hypothetical protein [Candidatus Dependentiae bacterium]
MAIRSNAITFLFLSGVVTVFLAPSYCWAPPQQDEVDNTVVLAPEDSSSLPEPYTGFIDPDDDVTASWAGSESSIGFDDRVDDLWLYPLGIGNLRQEIRIGGKRFGKDKLVIVSYMRRVSEGPEGLEIDMYLYDDGLTKYDVLRREGDACQDFNGLALKSWLPREERPERNGGKIGKFIAVSVTDQCTLYVPYELRKLFAKDIRSKLSNFLGRGAKEPKTSLWKKMGLVGAVDGERELRLLFGCCGLVSAIAFNGSVYIPYFDTHFCPEYIMGTRTMTRLCLNFFSTAATNKLAVEDLEHIGYLQALHMAHLVYGLHRRIGLGEAERVLEYLIKYRKLAEAEDLLKSFRGVMERGLSEHDSASLDVLRYGRPDYAQHIVATLCEPIASMQGFTDQYFAALHPLREMVLNMPYSATFLRNLSDIARKESALMPERSQALVRLLKELNDGAGGALVNGSQDEEKWAF